MTLDQIRTAEGADHPLYTTYVRLAALKEGRVKQRAQDRAFYVYKSWLDMLAEVEQSIKNDERPIGMAPHWVGVCGYTNFASDMGPPPKENVLRWKNNLKKNIPKKS